MRTASIPFCQRRDDDSRPSQRFENLRFWSTPQDIISRRFTLPSPGLVFPGTGFLVALFTRLNSVCDTAQSFTQVAQGLSLNPTASKFSFFHIQHHHQRRLRMPTISRLIRRNKNHQYELGLFI
jgi:hypothetical protein